MHSERGIPPTDSSLMLRVDRFASCVASKLFRPSGVAGAILSIEDSGDGEEEEGGDGKGRGEEGGGKSADPRASSEVSEGSRSRLRLRDDGDAKDKFVEEEGRDITPPEEALVGLVKEGRMCGDMKSIC